MYPMYTLNKHCSDMTSGKFNLWVIQHPVIVFLLDFFNGFFFSLVENSVQAKSVSLHQQILSSLEQ